MGRTRKLDSFPHIYRRDTLGDKLYHTHHKVLPHHQLHCKLNMAHLLLTHHRPAANQSKQASEGGNQKLHSQDPASRPPGSSLHLVSSLEMLVATRSLARKLGHLMVASIPRLAVCLRRRLQHLTCPLYIQLSSHIIEASVPTVLTSACCLGYQKCTVEACGRCTRWSGDPQCTAWTFLGPILLLMLRPQVAGTCAPALLVILMQITKAAAAFIHHIASTLLQCPLQNNP